VNATAIITPNPSSSVKTCDSVSVSKRSPERAKNDPTADMMMTTEEQENDPEERKKH
jgi:hypothetical protein